MKTVANYPNLVSQWHPTKNGDLKPEDFKFGSHKKVWWKCPIASDHEWQDTVAHRTNGRNCPCCHGLKVVKSNCLETKFPEIAKQWHPTKNGKLTPRDVVYGSGKKVWCKCPVAKDHEWEKKINARTSGINCPCCSNYKVVKSNCLLITHPEIAKQWHPFKNTLKPDDVVSGSHEKVWWVCHKKHEWQAMINDRRSGYGCPICMESRGENIINKILIENNISFERQCKFPTCKNKRPLPFDFVLNVNNKIKIIEYQGKQHYFLSFGGRSSGDNLKKTKINDFIKKKWCENEKIPFLEIPYWDFDKIEELLFSFIH